MDLFVLFLFTFITVLNFVEGQYFPRQIMPINTQQQQQQFNPFLSNYQLMKMQQQIQQQQQQMLQAAAMFQQPPQMPMQRTQQGILQSPAVTGDISNPTFQQQQQSRSVPFQVSFNGGQKKNEQVATPFNGGGLIPITEKLLDSNSEQLPSSVGNVKRDNLLLSESVQEQQPPQQQSTLSPPQIESLPPFLQGAPKEVIDEFKRILRQPQLSYDAKVQQVQALVNTLSPDRQQLYQQFMGQQNQLETTPSSTILSPPPPLLHRHPTRPPSRMPQRSPPGDDGFSMITKILQDESIPENERWKQIVGIYGEAEPRVKNENPFAFDGIVN